MEVVQSIWTRVDLDSSQYSKSLLNASLSSVHNIGYQSLLRVVESIRELPHAILSPSEALSERQDKLLHGPLLKVSELLNFRGYSSTSVGNPFKVVRSSDGRSAAVVYQSDSRSFDLPDLTFLGNSDMWSVNQETESIIRNVGGHGPETGVSGERESRKTTKVEVVSVDLHKLVFQFTGELVGTKGRGQKRVGRFESLLSQ
mmetsp:Transcript_27429/g.55367  ORF Transcript_27429/g.55367 Transcript_27429/m.55367 type:complete len:201 (-) Transcript_27429:301-903(-)